MNTFIFDIDGTLLDNVEAYLYGLQKHYAAMAERSPFMN
ncbi:haloacid dehalogenase-like hydrolase [Lacticaseibacillus paracasei]|nr:haloacid dehalogenase-like hydrolase [Lacticaseibacillus paracasei]